MMSKVSSIELPDKELNLTKLSNKEQNPIEFNALSVGQKDINKLWTTDTIVEQLRKIEVWGNRFGANLVQRSEKYKTHKKSPIVLIIKIFLYVFAVKTLVCQILIDKTSTHLLLIFGDLSQFYGSAVNRLYFNSFLISWGFLAAFVYSLISGEDKKEREWVLRFDENWRNTYFRSPNVEKRIVDNLLKNASTSVKAMKLSVVFYVLFVTVLSIIGGVQYIPAFDNHSIVLYIGWSVVYIMWSAMASMVNMTALFQFILLTRAIIIRFSEVNIDFEFSIRNKPPSESWVLSKLFEKHYTVCDMVIGSNQYFKKYIFFFFLTLVTHECYLFYQMATSMDTSLSVKCVALIYIIAEALQILLVSVCSAKITSMAHRPYHVVHGVGEMVITDEVQMQVQLFVERLSGGTIGMTILDGFVASGGVLSSILTGIVTYFSIIVEMH